MNPYSEIYSWSNDALHFLFASSNNPLWVCDQDLDGDDQYRVYSYLLGFSNSNFNCIDVSDIKSGSYFDITMKYHMFYMTNDQMQQPYLKAIWYNEKKEEIATSTYFQDWTSVNIDGDHYTAEFVYEDTVTFTVPEGSAYVAFLHDTGIQKRGGQHEDSYQFDYITFTADLSVFEYESRTMQAVQDKLDQMQQEEEKQTGLLGNIVTGIKELPSKIVSGIKQAVTDLFVPDEAQIIDMKEDWTNLLSDRFGAVYESAQIIDDFASAFTEKDAISSLEIPKVTVNLAGSNFTFGGWYVKLVPDGFSDVISVLKVIINIVCTLAFINAMRKRLESVVH